MWPIGSNNNGLPGHANTTIVVQRRGSCWQNFRWVWDTHFWFILYSLFLYLHRLHGIERNEISKKPNKTIIIINIRKNLVTKWATLKTMGLWDGACFEPHYPLVPSSLLLGPQRGQGNNIRQSGWRDSKTIHNVFIREARIIPSSTGLGWKRRRTKEIHENTTNLRKIILIQYHLLYEGCNNIQLSIILP